MTDLPPGFVRRKNGEVRDLNRVCPECGQHFVRESRGAEPNTCPDCRTKAKKRRLNEVLGYEKYDVNDPTPTAPRKQLKLSDDELAAEAARAAANEKAAEPLPVPAWVEEPEASWLDDPDVQTQVDKLLQEQDAAEAASESAVPSAGDGVVEGEDNVSPAKSSPTTCAVGACGMERTHGGAFCLNHWLQVDLNDRGVLIVAEPGGPVHDRVMAKALRSLR